jgi:hypothetical protein
MSAPNTVAIAGGTDARLAAYATLAGIILGSTAAAKATIVYSGPININIPSTADGIYINLVTGLTGTSAASVPGWDISPWGTTTFNVWANNPASPNSGIITNWPGGTSSTLTDNIGPVSLEGAQFPIDSSWNFGRTSSIETTGSTTFLLNSNQNWIGYRFLNEQTGMYNYGWARFSLASSFGGQPRTLVEYAFENNGGPILPEPSTNALLTLFAAGAFGIRAWRRKRT